MTICFRNIYKFFVHCIFIQCLLIFSCLMANALLKEEIKQIWKYGGETPLRGEIWYGHASWYGSKWHGKRTSSGEKFSKNKLTAAHKTLPFNTMVLVTNLKNNKSVMVRINDRGPFIRDRIIDLSEKAAERIDSKKEGIAYVKLQVLMPSK
ncbi:MAG: septal ring lytic transglycosylase RlpA family protein [Candidatus Melainabacteria bacterium]|nr:septal ring lytic transglycosylase RlpA family protein [Candidatus Melainabacteria bacterium]